MIDIHVIAVVIWAFVLFLSTLAVVDAVASNRRFERWEEERRNNHNKRERL